MILNDKAGRCWTLCADGVPMEEVYRADQVHRRCRILRDANPGKEITFRLHKKDWWSPEDVVQFLMYVWEHKKNQSYWIRKIIRKGSPLAIRRFKECVSVRCGEYTDISPNYSDKKFGELIQAARKNPGWCPHGYYEHSIKEFDE